MMDYEIKGRRKILESFIEGSQNELLHYQNLLRDLQNVCPHNEVRRVLFRGEYDDTTECKCLICNKEWEE